jgi:competence protein ComEC
VRQHGDLGIHAYLPEPQASRATGVLLGGSGRLSAAFRLDLQRSGLAHLVAIDGFKQLVVAATLGAAVGWLAGARSAILTSVAGVVGYTLLTGGHPSAVRAGLMVGLASLASLTGRVADPLTSLLVAVLAMGAVEPRVLLDVGLQLSLSATLGIVLLWPRVRRRLRRLPRPIAEPVGLTLAVTLATLPVTLRVFEQVSLVSPLAHIVAVPLLAPVLVSAALLAACAPIAPLATAAAWLAWLPSSLLAGVIQLFGGLPAAALSTGRLPGPAALVLAGSLLAWGVWGLPELAELRLDWRRWRAGHAGLLAPTACIGACSSAAALLLLLRPDGQLHIDPLAVGRGQAVFIRGPTGRTALIVSGRPDAVLLVGAVATHLAVWEHQLDVLLLDASAERGVALTLSRYPAGRVSRLEPPARIEVGGGAVLEVASVSGRLQVDPLDARSGRTTSAARPG